MSLKAVLWATENAPIADVEEFALLTIMAKSADDDGCNAFRSQPHMATRARIDPRTVRRRLDALEKRGVIRRGDQSRVAHLPADKRPVVWDLQIPYSWFPDPGEINEYRLERGRPPLTPESRPSLGPPPPPKRRRDVGQTKPRAAEDTDFTAGLEDLPQAGGESGANATGLGVPPDSESRATGLQVQSDRTTSPTTQSLTQSLTQSSLTPSTLSSEKDSDSVQPALDGSIPAQSRAEPGPREVALGIARAWTTYRSGKGTPVVVGSRSDPVHAVAKLVEPFLANGYTESEVKRALNGLGVGLPSSQQMDRALADIRNPQARSAHRGNGHRPATTLDVNAAWDDTSAGQPVAAVAGGAW